MRERRRRRPRAAGGSSCCPPTSSSQARWLRALREMPLEPETLYVDPSLVAVVDTEDPGEVLADAAHADQRAAI